MKRILNLTLLLCALSFTQMIGQIRTPSASPQATMSQVVGLGEITLEYSSPRKTTTIAGHISSGSQRDCVSDCE